MVFTSVFVKKVLMLMEEVVKVTNKKINFCKQQPTSSQFCLFFYCRTRLHKRHTYIQTHTNTNTNQSTKADNKMKTGSYPCIIIK